MTAAFNPARRVYMLKIRGGQTPYMDVQDRIAWLRAEHPDAHIVTEAIEIGDRAAIFRATVSIPGGGSSAGYGSETAADFGDFIEKAETKAIGRALLALGYSAEFVRTAQRRAAR